MPRASVSPRHVMPHAADAGFCFKRVVSVLLCRVLKRLQTRINTDHPIDVLGQLCGDLSCATPNIKDRTIRLRQRNQACTDLR
jgi:hypothetical protein